MKLYDTVIIGAGPAGLSAALYAGRAMLSTLIIEKGVDGGQIIQTSEIVNYPGGVFGENGVSLIERMTYQIDEFGVDRVYDEVQSVSFDGQVKEIVCAQTTYHAKTVIIATGAVPRALGCPGEEQLIGKGISHCATCDGAFFRGLDVYVIGGGDAALEEAVFLTKFVRSVTVVHRSQEFRAAKSIMEKAKKSDKISFLTDTVVKEIKGENRVAAMIVENVSSGQKKEIKPAHGDQTFGIFIFIGLKPQTELFEDILQLEKGYIVTDHFMRTNIEGVFAAGDIRVKSLRQVVTAVSDGAIAAVEVEKYVENLKIS